MKLTTQAEPLDVNGNRVYFKSADGCWFIGTKPVIFGMRVIAWRDRSAGPTVAHNDAVGWEYVTSTIGTRAVIEHLAAELTHAGHQSAAAWVMGQLRAEVIELRPRTPEDAA